ncbi:MAG: secondary thiamine-phosphate synthase enzyme YjbQ, partial [Candidatus Brocadiae bacterium]|nr:secondary thiamine-phosphate synthase enzyme YjbQ [Candidatus Brocadiia bacterium]
MKTFSVRTTTKTEFIDITSEVQKVLSEAGLEEGICLVFVPHTTAGVTINENADPSVRKDVLKELNKIVPFQDDYQHLEGNSAAHIKSSMVGCSCVVAVQGSRLALGTWQGIYF